MTKEYTPFPAFNFKSPGLDEANEPWLIPRDAFQLMQNCHLYRGVIDKIPGYTFYAAMSYRDEVALSGTIDGVNKTFTGTLTPVPTTNNTTVQATVNAGATQTEIFTDDGTGTLTGNNGGTGTLDYSTGAISVTFGTAPVDLTVGGVQYNTVIAQWDHAPDMARPIMGIKPFIGNTGGQEILIFDTRRMGKIVVLLADMATLQQSDYGISEVPHEVQSLNAYTFPGMSTGPFTGTLGPSLIPLIPGSVTFTIYTGSTSTSTLVPDGTITDNSSGGLVGPLLDPAMANYINYATGEWVMNFLSAPTMGWQMNFSGCVYGNVFTGNFSNFFVVTSGQENLGANSTANATFITNGVDSVRYYDGMCLKFLNTNLSSKPNTIAPYDIGKCLHVLLYRERLLLIAPTVFNTPAFNAIYWSVAQDPYDFTNDEQLFASTSENIKTFGVINTDLVVRFSNSERVFRYTGDAFSPFRWDPTNVIWRCDASYSAINYDKWFSSVGKPAIVGSDGVNVKRADEIIPDFTLNLRISEQQPVLSIDQESIGQCYGERFDDFKEGWLCYRSYDPLSDTGVKPSNSVLSFSYLYNTYTVYTFPFSCLGFGRIIADDVWGNNFDEWQEADYTWDTYTQTDNALIDLAGDQNGIVYKLGTANSITDMDGNEIPCLFEAITKDFNPFVEQGELARLGYVDFLLSSNDNTTFRVQFYIDNKMDTQYNTYYQETTLQLPGNGQSKIWKRIYVGAVGKEHTMRIYQNAADFVDVSQNQPLRIHAIVPYFKAAGRIFN